MSVLLCPQARHEFGERRPDLVRGIFLEKVSASDRDLSLVRPGPAEFARAARHDRARLADDKKLWNGAMRQKCPGTLDDRRNIGGLAFDRDLSRPYERREPRFALEKRGAVGTHLFVAELPQNASRQD